MKFFTSSIVAFGVFSSFFASAAVIPAGKVEVAALEKRDVDLSVAITVVEAAYAKIQVWTGKINSTIDGLSDPVTTVESTVAAVQINAAIAEITIIIRSAVAEVNGAAPDALGKVLATRQVAPTDLAGAVTLLLLEISGTLNGVITALGLKVLLAGTLGGLVASLSGLLLALIPVVNNLLELVRDLLDGLLLGLSAALAGLII
ncbi:hypothetical protein TWF481_010920 [Arthrobotrys musiformis]|uniref:Uncharacterized protein n=1 Tax=Arthrobotrys musiformis TaxID=47236 RepID=A0AAV9VWZ3_9PEZI